MTIETNSSRLAWVARTCRWFPPGLSGFFLRLYPTARAKREQPRFVARSSLADVTLADANPDWVAMNFAIRGFYEWLNVTIANIVCGRGDCIVEVGANIGTETILFARIAGNGGQVVSFEPVPANFAALRANLEQNSLKNVRVVNAAVSDSAGTLRFEPPRADENQGQGRVNVNGAAADAIEVPAVVLDELFAAGELRTPRMLVIDVQGAEMLVLRGAQRMLSAAKPYVIWEAEEELLRGFGCAPAEVAKFLRDLGYRHWQITKWGLREVGDHPAAQYNCLSIPDGDRAERIAEARRISAKIRRAALLPLIPGLNPAVICGDRSRA